MLNKENLHHAYCLLGEKSDVFERLRVFFEDELAISTKGNPDFYYADFETLTIEEGRNLKERQQNKAFNGGRKIFVISASFITREAQNSLLKIFEEPTEGTHFFLILPSPEILIPTLKSRLEIIHLGGRTAKVDDLEIKKFTETGKSERLRSLKELIEKKDKQKAIDFLNRLEVYLRKNSDLEKMKKEEVNMFSELTTMKKYLADRGSSIKMILEHIALFLK